MSKWKDILEKLMVEIISILIMYTVIMAVAVGFMTIVAGIIKLIR